MSKIINYCKYFWTCYYCFFNSSYPYCIVIFRNLNFRTKSAPAATGSVFMRRFRLFLGTLYVFYLKIVPLFGGYICSCCLSAPPLSSPTNLLATGFSSRFKICSEKRMLFFLSILDQMYFHLSVNIGLCFHCNHNTYIFSPNSFFVSF